MMLQFWQWTGSQGGVTPIDSIVTAVTALSQQLTVKPLENVQSTVNKTINVQIPVRNRPRLQLRTCWWVYTSAERLLPNIQARGLGLQFKYQDFFAGKILSERSKVNGQKLVWSTVKPPKRALTRGHSRVYGSDTPLGVTGS